MLKIKDVEEKRLILTYYLSKKKRDNKCFSEVTVWHKWADLWTEDFRTETGKVLKRYDNQFVLSKTKAKKQRKEGTLTQDFKEYDDFLMETCQWVNENHKRNKNRTRNANIMKERLLVYKKQCRVLLREYFKENEFWENGYKFINKTLKKAPLEMGKYLILVRNKEGKYEKACYGSYDTVMEFMKKEKEKWQKNE